MNFFYYHNIFQFLQNLLDKHKGKIIMQKQLFVYKKKKLRII